MGVDLTQLSDADRQDFSARLAVFGLDSTVVSPELSVPNSSQIRLAHGQGRESFVKPVVLQVRDFTQLKRMIGVDDRIAQARRQITRLPERLELRGRGNSSFVAAVGMPQAPAPQIADTLSSVDLKALSPTQLDNIRRAARTFVRGNSNLVGSFQPVLEHTIGAVEVPVFLFLVVRVARGATLEFGPGNHALCAWKVQIEPGGRIISRGHLTISCTIMSQPSLAFPLNPNVFNVASGATIFRRPV